ncbi:iron-sulfur cluster biosynthesis protein [Enterococcus dongliensis]|uniref:Iron-sulfur cluster biosynthesis protein n=1 Tax=Enterococcus dongliensis TaxID=2559925 RepID=A0AAW8TF11_9ENTE|nr:iron-sulfur cluster biosynthesis protein [Enterococcus dongliensis]MDT2633440.1 iron-sulfur cluster biosynthesis protein [Enterococcus dongliensis]MDT2636791.1 iron-sulfur cluster biosynthesis protein [Enterococcus dongliensis]MDT2638910.1 iron-sulfur cluster biosynthesis protein [Enterococcus dongliensis]MDT2641338.1 iron-sulfur cluster biosynthesis protein [Enterococcus dongliensis]MDT2646558.1 iron-sulfur cluster biosynthesis protein [Enterococcus dongliensis]
MKLTITPQAQNWFKKELAPAKGQGIKFYGKVYGKTQVHEGFSVGMAVDTPEDPLLTTTIGEQLFYIEATDEWFFEGFNLVVDYDEKLDEPKYEFVKE